jgi:hypothetical protein
LNDVTVTDDNGANNPGLFTPPGAALPTGSAPQNMANEVVYGPATLGPGKYSFTKTLYPAVTFCGCVDSQGKWESPQKNGTCQNSTLSQVGTLTTQKLSNGNYQLTYLQSFALNDNTYGANAVGWGGPGKHKFMDLVGSDQAEFDVTGSKDFYMGEIDYIANTTGITFPGGGSATYPSGWGTAGDEQHVQDSDGKFIGGNDSALVFATTTLTQDLNHSAACGTFTTDSPPFPISSSSCPTWNVIDGYQIIVSGSIIGNLTNVSIPEVHNSPSKMGEVKNPVYCPMPSINTATVTAVNPATGRTLSSSSKACVTLTGSTTSCP